MRRWPACQRCRRCCRRRPSCRRQRPPRPAASPHLALAARRRRPACACARQSSAPCRACQSGTFKLDDSGDGDCGLGHRERLLSTQ